VYFDDSGTAAHINTTLFIFNPYSTALTYSEYFTVLKWPDPYGDKELIAILAAKKDRDYWLLPVILIWLWIYLFILALWVRRLMISISGWLAKVGKKRKSGK